MRAFQVFARMAPEQAEAMLALIAQKAPGLYAQALAAAAGAMKARPAYLVRQPPARRADAVRRALARVTANEAAEELLATYFLDCRRDLLVEWLDAVGLEHEEGILQGIDPPQPSEPALEKAVNGFRTGDDAADRELLLRAFAAQAAIDWPALDALL